jgi:hypothetical protein
MTAPAEGEINNGAAFSRVVEAGDAGVTGKGTPGDAGGAGGLVTEVVGALIPSFSLRRFSLYPTTISPSI